MTEVVAIDKYPGSPDRLCKFSSSGDLHSVLGEPTVKDNKWIRVYPHTGLYVESHPNLAWGYESTTLCIVKDLGMIEYPGYGSLQTYEIEREAAL